MGVLVSIRSFFPEKQMVASKSNFNILGQEEAWSRGLDRACCTVRHEIETDSIDGVPSRRKVNAVYAYIRYTSIHYDGSNHS